MPEQGAGSRPAAPTARAPATGGHDTNALNRPPFAGALAQPVNPAAAPDATKAQRPPPRPIVIEHFTPESLMPAETARRPATNTSQPPAAPSRGPKESNFVASSAASSGHVDGPELTPSDVAAALESGVLPGPEPSVPRFLLPLAIGTVIVLALALVGVYVLRTHINSTAPVVEAYQDSPLPSQADATPPAMAAEETASPPAASGSSTLRPGDAATPAMPVGQPAGSLAATPTGAATPTVAAAPAAAAASGAATVSGAPVASEAASPSDTAAPPTIHEEIPEIPPRIRESIRGHVRVAVRLIVDKEGSVFAALVDEPGPSRYFERLAIEAAKKWTFPPMDTTGSRLELVRFDFTRQGATGRAVEIE